MGRSSGGSQLAVIELLLLRTPAQSHLQLLRGPQA